LQSNSAWNSIDCGVPIAAVAENAGSSAEMRIITIPVKRKLRRHLVAMLGDPS
jgi:hypothetical protein